MAYAWRTKNIGPGQHRPAINSTEVKIPRQWIGWMIGYVFLPLRVGGGILVSYLNLQTESPGCSSSLSPKDNSVLLVEDFNKFPRAEAPCFSWYDAHSHTSAVTVFTSLAFSVAQLDKLCSPRPSALGSCFTWLRLYRESQIPGGVNYLQLFSNTSAQVPIQGLPSLTRHMCPQHTVTLLTLE
jgi:hypothetical protein